MGSQKLRLGRWLSLQVIDMTIDRDWLQERYIQWDLNQMSNDQLRQFFIDTQNRELGDLDDDELIYEVEQYAPELFV